MMPDNSLEAFHEAERLHGDIDQRSFDAGYDAARREFALLAHKADRSITKLLLYVDDFCINDSHVLEAKDLQFKLKETSRGI